MRIEPYPSGWFLSRRALYGLLLLAALVGCPALGVAQQAVSSATVSGSAEDATGATIGGATITITNLEQNQSRSTRSDDRGRFKFLYLPVGIYRITAVHEGFSKVETRLALSVGQSMELSLRMPVAGVTERVSVTAEIPIVEPTRTQLSETILPREIESLPLNGRNYLDLAALTPAVSRANPVGNQRFSETSAVPGTQLSVIGQRSINNGFVMDGLSANDDAADLPGTFYSQEVIREFQVIPSGGTAEFGRASAGIVNIITQSGTNAFRGRAYGFFRNQRLDARNPLAQTKDPLTQAQYGASVGGPLIHDRSFLFANFEQSRLHFTVPLTILPANVRAINSFLNQVHFAGPRIDTGLAPTGYNSTNFLARIDHRLGAAHQLAARYSFYDIDSVNARGVGGLNAVSRGTGLENRDQTFAISEIASVTARLSNETRFQFTRSLLAAPPNDLVGPAVSVSGVANLGTSTSSPTARNLDLWELVDNVTILRGPHSLKAGADFLYNRIDIIFPGALEGAYTFSSLANLQSSRYVTFQQAFGAPGLFQSNPNAGFFTQDEWRVRKDLTINGGLRYDLQFLPAPIQTDTSNIAPRVGIAYAPGAGKTVIRAGYGIYYDRIPLRATSNALQRDGTKYRVATFSFGQAGAPAFPAVAMSFPVGFLPSITTIDPHINKAYAQQASLQVERELTERTSIALGYLHARALHLILSRNINAPTLTAAQAVQLGIPNLGRPNPDFANILRYESSGDSYYHSLTISLNRRFSGWVGARVSYTLSKAIDDAGNAFFSAPQDNFNLRDDRGLADSDQRHLISLSGTIAAPSSGGGSAGRRVLEGLVLSWIFRYGSALPFNVVTGTDRNNDTTVNDRPAGVGRNTGRGFDFAALDLRMSRRIRITERLGLEVLAEGFNLLNRSNLQLPNATFGPGSVPAQGFGSPTAAADPRQLQLGLRLSF